MSKKQKNRNQNKRTEINPEIQRSLGVIFLFILAGLCILSYFNLGGVAGFYLNKFTGLIFGQLRLIFPLAIIFIALSVEFSERLRGTSRHFWGFLLLILGIEGLMHLKIPAEEALSLAEAGGGGGLLGFGLNYALQKAFGFWATLTILVGFILAAVILILNTTLGHIVQTQKNLLAKLGMGGKIIIGVLTLFAKKPVASYSSNLNQQNVEPETTFQAQKIKAMEPKEPKPEPESKKEDKDNDLKDAHEALLDNPIISKKSSQKLPPLSLLTSLKSHPSAGDIKGNLYTIQKTFQNFNIPVEMGEVKVGPTVTQYSLKPADGIKLSRITSLTDNLALALAAHPIRIEAPIPGKSLVGIEIPNQKIALVTLRELLESKDWQSQRGVLKVAVGKDVSGRPWFTDITSLPHLLVAGATGSGKTIYLNALILSLLLTHTSETLRFIFVDPKRVELHLYNGIPHLLTPVITDTQKTVNALRWTIGEMERRLEILSKAGKRNLKEYNAVMEEKIPYIVFVIDELADLMATSGAEVEGSIVRLAQLARATGIHLVLATQRPSVDVITGLIKANFPARMAFSVTSLMDSRTILDCSGAEKLLGRGDMLWSGPEMSKPQRLQGAYISEEEIKKVTEFLKNEEVPQYNDEIVAKQQGTLALDGDASNSNDDDPLLEEAKTVLLQAGKGSASLLQRRLKVGYARAARLLDLLEAQGFIGPADGAKPREILAQNIDSIPSEHEMPAPETNNEGNDDEEEEDEDENNTPDF